MLPLAELGIEDVDAVLSINLRGTLLTAKYAIRHLRRPGGSESLARALAVELGGDGIRVNGIAPGFIKTEMSDRFTHGRDMRPFYEANVPLGRIGEASEIADAMVWLASDQGDHPADPDRPSDRQARNLRRPRHRPAH